MQILRVQVPSFRALQNIDISFEKEYFPKIFPLGSQNGGGKSTLLQLIFVLLHCSTNPDRLEFLTNFLESKSQEYFVENNLLAKLEILVEDINVELEFFFCSSQYIQNLEQNDILLDEIIEVIERLRQEIADDEKTLDSVKKG